MSSLVSPADLESIVLKAIAKNPDERYSTAAELADDLRAFEEGRSVKAKPLTVVQRSWKWARRHQGLVVAAVIVLLATTLGLATATIVISREQSRTESALEEARDQGQRAEENFHRARSAVDSYLTRVSEDELLNVPGLQPLRKDLLELALTYYQQFVAERNDDAELSREFAAAHFRVGDIRASLGDSEEALKSHQMALELREALFKKPFRERQHSK